MINQRKDRNLGVSYPKKERKRVEKKKTRKEEILKKGMNINYFYNDQKNKLDGHGIAIIFYCAIKTVLNKNDLVIITGLLVV